MSDCICGEINARHCPVHQDWMTLATHVEVISDDFQSTFIVVSENVLANMLGMPGEFEKLTEIVRNYIPDAELKFTKTNQLEDDYDIYLVELM